MNKSCLVKQYIKAAPIVLRNQICIHLPSFYLLDIYNSINDQITYLYSILNFFINMSIAAILFTIVHHIFHKFKFLYMIHKKHHSHIKTIGITSEYQNLTEQLINWGFLTWGPLFIFNMNSFCMYVYILIQATYGVIGHSGYELPLIKYDVQRHWLHHKYFKYNYGMELYDKLMKTNLESEDELKTIFKGLNY